MSEPTERARDAQPWNVPGSLVHFSSWSDYLTHLADCVGFVEDADRLRALAETLGRVTPDMAEAVEACVADAGRYLDNHLGGRSPHDQAQLDGASAAVDLLAALTGGTEGR